MEIVWRAIRGWEDAQIIHLVHSAILFANSSMLSMLNEPPEKRVLFSQENYHLGYYAEMFAKAIENNRELAKEFWSEPLGDFLQKLHAFAQHQYDRAQLLWELTAEISMPSRRGRGNRREIAYGNAISKVLKEIGLLSLSKQDEIIATLSEVVFDRSGKKQIDAERIRARRKRDRRKSK
jgi:hypothetical protein